MIWCERTAKGWPELGDPPPPYHPYPSQHHHHLGRWAVCEASEEEAVPSLVPLVSSSEAHWNLDGSELFMKVVLGSDSSQGDMEWFKVTMALLPPGFHEPLYPDMINAQDIEHMIPPTPPRDTEPPVGSPIPLSPSSSVGSSSLAAIRKLVADSVAAALKAQAATMANTDNTNRNTRQSGLI
ncbi:hypothetical protein Tco_0468019, partial [Tanacetum coccineum]